MEAENFIASNKKHSRAPIVITICGITYPSITSAAKTLKISRKALANRIKAGLRDEELIDSFPNKNKKGIKITIQNKTYDTLSAVAKEYKINLATIYSRYKSGKRDEDLIKNPRKFKKERIPKTIVINGTEYPSLKRAAQEIGIPYQTLISKVNRGVAPNNLADVNVKRDILFRGEYFDGIKELAKKYNISKSNVYMVYYQYNCSIEEAMEILLERKNKRACIVEGVEYKSFSSVCRAYNKSAAGVKKELENGRELEEILLSTDCASKPDVAFRGEHFRSKNACYRKYGVHPTKVQKDMRCGLSFSEAMEKAIADIDRGGEVQLLKID